VCLAPISDDGLASVQTACGHSFHLYCLLRCLEYRGVACPVCRQPIDSELAGDQRPWMGCSAGSRGSSGGGGSMPFPGHTVAETAVAVEIAESVRRSLAEEEVRRPLADSVAPHPSAFQVSQAARRARRRVPDVLFQEPEVNRVRPYLEERLRPSRIWSSTRRSPSLRRRSHSASPAERQWYTEIAQAVAAGLAQELAMETVVVPGRRTEEVALGRSADLLRGLVPSATSSDAGVDPGVLAGLEEADPRHYDDGGEPGAPHMPCRRVAHLDEPPPASPRPLPFSAATTAMSRPEATDIRSPPLARYIDVPLL